MKEIIYYILYVVSQVPDQPDSRISYHTSKNECMIHSEKLINQGLSSYCVELKGEK